jgi:hypothetical protein
VFFGGANFFDVFFKYNFTIKKRGVVQDTPKERIINTNTKNKNKIKNKKKFFIFYFIFIFCVCGSHPPTPTTPAHHPPTSTPPNQQQIK